MPVRGSIAPSHWTDKDGNKRRNAEVLADNIYFGDAKRDTDSDAAQPTGFTEIEDDGDLPF